MAKRDKRRMAPRVDVRKLRKRVMENLPEFLLLKRRGGGITYAIDVDALPKMDVEKWKRMAMGNYGSIVSLKDVVEPHMLKGASMNIAEMNVAMYGSMDPDTEMLRGITKEMFEAAMPKGFPMYCNDLKQMLDDKANKYLPHTVWQNQRQVLEHFKRMKKFPKQENEHSAIDDARWNKQLFEFLTQL